MESNMSEASQSSKRVDIKLLPNPCQESQDKSHRHICRFNGHSNSDSSSSIVGCEMNYCEVYYLSPSKRKNQDNVNIKNNISKSNSQMPRDNEKSFPVSSYPGPIISSSFDENFDTYEIGSQFSDLTPTSGIHLNKTRSNNVTFSNCTEEKIHLNKGSLRRSKGRSNQSLCSCDADTEIIPNPDRPLYQYSLDRKNKTHTYTCEQNAQILMRLERVRQKSISTIDKAQIYCGSSEPLNGHHEESSAELAKVKTDISVEGDSMIDVDVIPPPPPPIPLSRKQWPHQPRFVKAFMGTNKHESLLNDCTSTILTCANTGQIVVTKPDLCNSNRTANPQQTDTVGSINIQENISLAPYSCTEDDIYAPCFKNEENSLFFYQQELPQYVPSFAKRSHSGKFNTIGPSSYYTKKFSQQQNNSCNFGLFASNNLSCKNNNGRYFSQSLSNFSFGGLQGHDGYQSQPHNHGYSTTPYTQFRTSTNGLSCSLGESMLINSSYTSTGSTTSGLKDKLHHQQHHHSNMPWRHRQCPSRGSSSSSTNSLRFDPSRHWLAVSSILLIVGAASVAVPLALRVAASAPFEERLEAAIQLLDAVPLIDGHNDLPWNIRKFLHNKLNEFNFDEDLSNVMPWARSHWSHTDLHRLKKGRVAAQFWAAYVPCEAQHRDAVQLTLEQIDVIKRLTERYSPQLTSCTSASDIIEAHKNHQLCSLTGVEGGHSLGGSLAVLRTLYAIGVRYMTLTSTCHTPWADSSHADAPKYDVKHGGLTIFGKTIIREMNRLGMIVDLSHVSVGTMRDALTTTEAPVIFSHSSAYELCNSSRNVQDDILNLVAKNGGLVMVNFYSKFLSCSENSTVHNAVAHINHIKRTAGIDHVGLGAGFDGINFTPKGLEDVSTYPTLFAELLGEGWSVEDLTKLAGQNFLRVMSEVEKVRDNKKLAGIRPYEDHPNFRSEDPYNCTSS